MYLGVIGPSTQRACANCHVLHLASALSQGSRAWCGCTWSWVEMNVGDGFDANKGNRTAVQLYIDYIYRRDCKTSAASVALYPGRAGKIKPEHKYFEDEDKCQSIRLTDNSARAESAQDNSAPIMRRIGVHKRQLGTFV